MSIQIAEYTLRNHALVLWGYFACPLWQRSLLQWWGKLRQHPFNCPIAAIYMSAWRNLRTVQNATTQTCSSWPVPDSGISLIACVHPAFSHQCFWNICSTCGRALNRAALLATRWYFWPSKGLYVVDRFERPSLLRFIIYFSRARRRRSLPNLGGLSESPRIFPLSATTWQFYLRPVERCRAKSTPSRAYSTM